MALDCKTLHLCAIGLPGLPIGVWTQALQVLLSGYPDTSGSGDEVLVGFLSPSEAGKYHRNARAYTKMQIEAKGAQRRTY